MHLHLPAWPRRLAVLPALALLAGLPSSPARAADAPPEGETKSEFSWQGGPGKVSMGDDVAQLEILESEAFLDGPQTVKLLAKMGNQTSDKEVGLVRPVGDDEEEQWFAVFEYEEAGYVKDDEADKIDADELLKNIREATEEGNEYRKEHGAHGLHVDRWTDPPHYDASSHNLVWGLLAHDDGGGEVINYNVRILGREGYMSVTLVDDPKLIGKSKGAFEKVMQRFTYKPGKTYAEWRPGDKVAEYGLTALVAAGAGAAAVKLGLFKVLGKFAKFIFVGVAAGAAAVARFFKRLFGGRSSNPNGP